MTLLQTTLNVKIINTAESIFVCVAKLNLDCSNFERYKNKKNGNDRSREIFKQLKLFITERFVLI